MGCATSSSPTGEYAQPWPQVPCDASPHLTRHARRSKNLHNGLLVATFFAARGLASRKLLRHRLIHSLLFTPAGRWDKPVLFKTLAVFPRIQDAPPKRQDLGNREIRYQHSEIRNPITHLGKDEITFQEFTAIPKTSPRLAKAVSCCKALRLFSVDYVWIDTFCIDTTSSAELSESLNSMFRWY